MAQTNKKHRRIKEDLRKLLDKFKEKGKDKIDLTKYTRQSVKKQETIPGKTKLEHLKKLQDKTIPTLRLAEMMQLPQFAYLKEQTDEQFQAELKKPAFQEQMKTWGLKPEDLPVVLNEKTRQQALRALNMSQDIQNAVQSGAGVRNTLLETPPRGRGGEIVARVEKHPVLALGCVALGLFAMFKLAEASEDNDLGDLFVGLGAGGMATFMGLSMFGKTEMAKVWLAKKIDEIAENKGALKMVGKALKEKTVKGIDKLLGGGEFAKSVIALLGPDKVLQRLKKKVYESTLTDNLREVEEKLKGKGKNNVPDQSTKQKARELGEAALQQWIKDQKNDSKKAEKKKPKPKAEEKPKTGKEAPRETEQQRNLIDENINQIESLEKEVEKLREKAWKIKQEVVKEINNDDPDFQKQKEKYQTKWNDLERLYKKYAPKIKDYKKELEQLEAIEDDPNAPVDNTYEDKLYARIDFVEKYKNHLSEITAIKKELDEILAKKKKLEETTMQQVEEKSFKEILKEMPLGDPREIKISEENKKKFQEIVQKGLDGTLTGEETLNLVEEILPRTLLFIKNNAPYFANATLHKIFNVQAFIKLQYLMALKEIYEGTEKYNDRHKNLHENHPVIMTLSGMTIEAFKQTPRFVPIYAVNEVLRGNKALSATTRFWLGTKKAPFWFWHSSKFAFLKGYKGYKAFRAGQLTLQGMRKKVGRAVTKKWLEKEMIKRAEKNVAGKLAKKVALRLGLEALTVPLKIVSGVGLIWTIYDIATISNELRKGNVEKIYGESGKLLWEEIKKRRKLFQAVGSAGIAGLGETSGFDLRPDLESMRKEGSLRQAFESANQRILEINEKNPLEIPLPFFEIPSDLETYKPSDNTSSEENAEEGAMP